MSWACGRIFFENRPTFRFRSTEIEIWKMIFPLDICILWVRQVYAVYISLLLWFQTRFFLRWKGAMEHPARNVPCRHGEQKQWRRRGVQRWDINGSSKWEQCYEVLLRAVPCGAFSYEAPRPSFGCLPNFEWGIFLTCQSLSPITP